MDIRFLYPYWGNEELDAKTFISFVKSKGFDGIEINIPNGSVFETEFYDDLNNERAHNPNFICVLQQVLGIRKESPEDLLERTIKRLDDLLHYRPNFINSHTGRDYYSFEENCRIIEAVESFSLKSNIPVYHEIHRGRFTFHSKTTLEYLDKFPNLKLVGDLSHWCVVSESMLQNQEDVIKEVFPHIMHIHARVGFEQTPQVNNPFAPEWKSYLDKFINWWQLILSHHIEQELFTITPEFGPFPYMPQKPFSKEPISNQNEINFKLKNYLKTQLS